MWINLRKTLHKIYFIPTGPILTSSVHELTLYRIIRTKTDFDFKDYMPSHSSQRLVFVQARQL